MKYKGFKRVLDEHFNDEDEIFPHTGYLKTVSFYKVSPKQGTGMKYKDFKKALDEHFNDEDEIFPHAGFSHVSFYHEYHGQDIGVIVDDDGMTTINFAQKLNDNNSNTEGNA